MEQPYVKLSNQNGIGIIEFNHPEHNALPSDLLLKLEQTILNADNDPLINLIILKSGGDRTFVLARISMN